jgi:hypothetical protein
LNLKQPCLGNDRVVQRPPGGVREHCHKLTPSALSSSAYP